MFKTVAILASLVGGICNLITYYYYYYNYIIIIVVNN